MNNIKVGDRVRATAKTSDDFAEFTASVVSPHAVDSKTQRYLRDNYIFEVIEHSRPAVPGLYSFTTGGDRQLLLTTRGQFFLVDFTAMYEDVCVPIDEDDVYKDIFKKYEFVLNYKYAKSSARPVVMQR